MLKSRKFIMEGDSDVYGRVAVTFAEMEEGGHRLLIDTGRDVIQTSMIKQWTLTGRTLLVGTVSGSLYRFQISGIYRKPSGLDGEFFSQGGEMNARIMSGRVFVSLCENMVGEVFAYLTNAETSECFRTSNIYSVAWTEHFMKIMTHSNEYVIS